MLKAISVVWNSGAKIGMSVLSVLNSQKSHILCPYFRSSINSRFACKLNGYRPDGQADLSAKKNQKVAEIHSKRLMHTKKPCFPLINHNAYIEPAH
jgi:hypothetical protein